MIALHQRYRSEPASMLVKLCCMMIGLGVVLPTAARAQEIWEYSPYKVKYWLSVSPTLSLSPETFQEIQRKIEEHGELQMGRTWSIEVEPTPESLFGSVLYRMEEFSADHLLASELVLVVGKSEKAKEAFLRMNPPPPKPVEDPSAPKKKMSKEERDNLADLEARAASLQSVRTLDSAIERIKEIAIMPLQNSAMRRDIVPYLKEPQWAKFNERLKPYTGDKKQLMNQLSNGEVISALIQKIDWNDYKTVARQIPARLPWQPEALLRNNDKIFLVSVDKAGESIRVQVRELDAFVRRMSNVLTLEIGHLTQLPEAIVSLSRECFSPIVRIEESDFKTAVLRVRAGGLITTPSHPIQVSPGDVILPIIRRDDSNGNPLVVQAIPFTYIAVVEKIDSISKMYGAIFAASRGALAAAKNRRTQRVGLKVTPHYNGSSLKLGLQRQPDLVMQGAEIYWRTPGSDDMSMLGRTDWRGIINLEKQELPVIEYDPPSESKIEAIANARSISSDPVAPPEYRVPESANSKQTGELDASAVNQAMQTGSEKKNTTDPSTENASNDTKEGEDKTQEGGEPPPPAPPEPPPPTKKPKGFIQINVPLYLYYVKNGDTVLARLPIVNGFQKNEQADMPDDRRRLETEAFLKGLQGEVLDLVIRRKILEARIKQRIKDKKFPEATKLLDDLKKVKSYESLLEQIDTIQRRALNTDDGPLLRGVVTRIEGMLSTTRQVMQKYLQDPMVRNLELELESAR